MRRYNTMLDVAFSVEHSFGDPRQLLETKEGVDLILEAKKVNPSR